MQSNRRFHFRDRRQSRLRLLASLNLFVLLPALCLLLVAGSGQAAASQSRRPPGSRPPEEYYPRQNLTDAEALRFLQANELYEAVAEGLPRDDRPFIQTAKLAAADGAAADQFGVSVALDGDTALVGASLANVGANGDQGAAYVFIRTGSGWTEQARLTAADGASGDHFGTAVAVEGDTAIVGASLANGSSGTDQGAAYVFSRSGTAWTQQDKLTADDGAEWDQFGISVALSGDTALVGANFVDIGGNEAEGAAYVFTRSGAAWTQ